MTLKPNQSEASADIVASRPALAPVSPVATPRHVSDSQRGLDAGADRLITDLRACGLLWTEGPGFGRDE